MPTHEIEIRRASVADFETLIAFHRALYVDHRNAVVPEEQLELIEYVDYGRVLEGDLRSLLKDGFVLVAVRDGSVVGYASGRIKTEPERMLSRKGFVEDWYVIDAARGQGVGAKLLAELEKIFVENHCDVLETVTWISNAAAIEAHRRIGFQPLMLTLRKPVKRA